MLMVWLEVLAGYRGSDMSSPKYNHGLQIEANHSDC